MRNLVAEYHLKTDGLNDLSDDDWDVSIGAYTALIDGLERLCADESGRLNLKTAKGRAPGSEFDESVLRCQLQSIWIAWIGEDFSAYWSARNSSVRAIGLDHTEELLIFVQFYRVNEENSLTSKVDKLVSSVMSREFDLRQQRADARYHAKNRKDRDNIVKSLWYNDGRSVEEVRKIVSSRHRREWSFYSDLAEANLIGLEDEIYQKEKERIEALHNALITLHGSEKRRLKMAERVLQDAFFAAID
jgi:hypothetical protein